MRHLVSAYECGNPIVRLADEAAINRLTDQGRLFCATLDLIEGATRRAMNEAEENGISRLETRLARLEAEAAIIRLKNRYFRAGDVGDMATLRDCFTDDAKIEFPGLSCGPDELHDAFVAQRAAYPGFFVHCGFNPRIEVIDTTHARGEWNLLFVSLLGGRKQSTSFGTYRDEYRLTEKGWRISSCHSQSGVSFTAQLDEAIAIEGGDLT